MPYMCENVPNNGFFQFSKLASNANEQEAASERMRISTARTFSSKKGLFCPAYFFKPLSALLVAWKAFLDALLGSSSDFLGLALLKTLKLSWDLVHDILIKTINFCYVKSTLVSFISHYIFDIQFFRKQWHRTERLLQSCFGFSYFLAGYQI